MVARFGIDRSNRGAALLLLEVRMIALGEVQEGKDDLNASTSTRKRSDSTNSPYGSSTSVTVVLPPKKRCKLLPQKQQQQRRRQPISSSLSGSFTIRNRHAAAVVTTGGAPETPPSHPPHDHYHRYGSTGMTRTTGNALPIPSTPGTTAGATATTTSTTAVYDGTSSESLRLRTVSVCSQDGVWVGEQDDYDEEDDRQGQETPKSQDYPDEMKRSHSFTGSLSQDSCQVEDEDDESMASTQPTPPATTTRRLGRLSCRPVHSSFSASGAKRTATNNHKGIGIPSSTPTKSSTAPSSPSTNNTNTSTSSTSSCTTANIHKERLVSPPVPLPYSHSKKIVGAQTTGPVKATLRKKFSWKSFPELEGYLVDHREQYMQFSSQLNYTAEQKRYNNTLTQGLLDLAAQEGYSFEGFTFAMIRDRIRCYYKSYVQASKKRKRRKSTTATSTQGNIIPTTIMGNPTHTGSRKIPEVRMN